MTGSATANRASAKREALLSTAQDLFSRQGYRAVGIDTLLAEAGVAKMTLYKQFGSKEELIAAVLERLAGQISSALTARLANAAGGSQGRILAVFDWLADWVRSPDFHGCLFIKAASEYPEATDRPRQAAETFKAGCRALLEEQCNELGIADPSRLARQLHLLLEGALVLSFLERDPRAATEAREAAAVLLTAAAHGS
ncbi:TetR/AcrR family transcriptional regulator [Synechococcus sp. CS-1324]|uniref:TetR/AcrR family transcriptional regulator n=1 Tax=Synechococcus sp. CS-1324 TaxID=2847980 RepID=UPI000DB18883|nr:TetR/AcrR family transcriptional regulator [Synechococcus sp. CS-1324]MCT0231763.1 TetR/AcrR family transcriptional regulator [Synechococcus sp. CS-1324]PZV04761.1 MAG: TetR/AcrR family transcriptional regulator [Cyanobium sp.]